MQVDNLIEDVYVDIIRGYRWKAGRLGVSICTCGTGILVWTYIVA